MKRKQPPPKSEPLVFTRADPVQLDAFDPRSKVCVMNCGPHRDDPRTFKERKFLCDDCEPPLKGDPQ